MHCVYLIHKIHNLSWITEINELFHNILIYWDAPVFLEINTCVSSSCQVYFKTARKKKNTPYKSFIVCLFTQKENWHHLLTLRLYKTSMTFFCQTQKRKKTVTLKNILFCLLQRKSFRFRTTRWGWHYHNCLARRKRWNTSLFFSF